MEVSSDNATVVLISFVGAANSPSGSVISFQGTNAPNQLATKINRKRVPTKGTQGRYSYSPIWSFAIPATYSKTDSTKFCNPFGTCSRFKVPSTAIVKIIAITSQVINKTWPCTVKPAMFQYKCVPTSTAANEKKT
jgi:hypothetical protein